MFFRSSFQPGLFRFYFTVIFSLEFQNNLFLRQTNTTSFVITNEKLWFLKKKLIFQS